MSIITYACHEDDDAEALQDELEAEQESPTLADIIYG